MGVKLLRHGVAWLCNGQGVGLATKRLRVRIPSCYCHVTTLGKLFSSRKQALLLPSSIIWYRCKDREGSGRMIMEQMSITLRVKAINSVAAQDLETYTNAAPVSLIAVRRRC